MLDDEDARADLAVVERRMSAVRAVRQVVNAIWAMAHAQLPLVEEALAAAEAWRVAIEGIVDRLVGATTTSAATARVLTVAIGPERPWCGALPRRLLAQLPPDGDLVVVGTRLQDVAMRDAALRARARLALPGATAPEQASEVAVAIATALLDRLDVDRVQLLVPRGPQAELVAVDVIGGARARRHDAPSTLSPWEDVLRAALLQAVTGRLTVAILQALAIEVQARAAAAEQARLACDRRLERLQQGWRVARQEEITNELIELVAGISAPRWRPG